MQAGFLAVELKAQSGARSVVIEEICLSPSALELEVLSYRKFELL
jgi:hypothetical protein